MTKDPKGAVTESERPASALVALERLAFLRRHLPSHGTHGEEMFNAFELIRDVLEALSVPAAPPKGGEYEVRPIPAIDSKHCDNGDNRSGKERRVFRTHTATLLYRQSNTERRRGWNRRQGEPAMPKGGPKEIMQHASEEACQKIREIFDPAMPKGETYLTHKGDYENWSTPIDTSAMPKGETPEVRTAFKVWWKRWRKRVGLPASESDTEKSAAFEAWMHQYGEYEKRLAQVTGGRNDLQDCISRMWCDRGIDPQGKSIEQLRTHVQYLAQNMAEWMKRALAAEAERDRAKQDAERYKWLHRHVSGTVFTFKFPDYLSNMDGRICKAAMAGEPIGPLLDAAIDAAMSEKGASE